MTEKADSILNSQLAVRVLRRIANQEEGDYGSRIADELDKSQASIGRILSELYEAGFIKKGKREKAQYYQIDYGSMSEYWIKTLKSGLSGIEGNIDRKKYLAEGYTTKEEMLNGIENNEEKIKETVSNYMELVLTGETDLGDRTVSDLMFKSFGISLGHNMVQMDSFFEKYPYLEYPKDVLANVWNLDGFAQKLRLAINKTEEGEAEVEEKVN